MSTRRTLAALAGLALLASACGGGSEGGGAAPGVDAVSEPAATEAPPAPAADAVAEPEAEPAPETGAEPATVPAALQFSAPLVGGGEIDAGTLAGKPTVFWFWAPI